MFISHSPTGSLIKVQHNFPALRLLPAPWPDWGSCGPNLFALLLESTPRADLHQPNLLLGYCSSLKVTSRWGAPAMTPTVVVQCQPWVHMRGCKLLQNSFGLDTFSSFLCLKIHNHVLHSFLSFLCACPRRGCIARACRLLQHLRRAARVPSRPLRSSTLLPSSGVPSWLHFITWDVIFLAFQPDLINCLPTSAVFFIPLL